MNVSYVIQYLPDCPDTSPATRPWGTNTLEVHSRVSCQMPRDPTDVACPQLFFWYFPFLDFPHPLLNLGYLKARVGERYLPSPRKLPEGSYEHSVQDRALFLSLWTSCFCSISLLRFLARLSARRSPAKLSTHSHRLQANYSFRPFFPPFV